MSLIIRNPHSVLAALETRPKDVKQITLSPHLEPGPWSDVEKLARSLGITVQTQNLRSGKQPNRDLPNDGRMSNAQAVIEERKPLSLDELWGADEIDPNEGALWIAMDCIQDPHNVGAIFRTAAFFGAKGIVLTQERSAPLTATAYEVASGGMEYVPFTLQVNLQRAFESAKKKGIWILGSSEHAKESLTKLSNDRPWLLVLGNEEKGMRRLTEEACDLTCSIPCSGKTTSLNVSVAAGVLISHLSL
jgi:23S rRNA (guanosine2251-2'-O)-methyltransferase